MKKAAALSMYIFILLPHAFSQNVDIGNTAPLARLDINGDIALRSADITIATTYTYALDVKRNKANLLQVESITWIKQFYYRRYKELG